MSDLLNPSQRNAVTITLRLFEEQLRQCEEWLEGREETGTLYRQRLSVPEKRRRLVKKQIAQALACIADLADRCGLSAEEENAAGMLSAGFAESWSALCDVHSDKLVRYGQLAPGLAQTLDPSIEAMIELSLSLAMTLSRDSNV